MHGRVGVSRSHLEQIARNDWGGRAICDDRSLLIEEAATAYKNCSQVVTDLETYQLVERVVAMRPLVTYKKAVERSGNFREMSDRRNKRDKRHEQR